MRAFQGDVGPNLTSRCSTLSPISSHSSVSATANGVANGASAVVDTAAQVGSAAAGAVTSGVSAVGLFQQDFTN
jgi:hypothetical protein